MKKNERERKNNNLLKVVSIFGSQINTFECWIFVFWFVFGCLFGVRLVLFEENNKYKLDYQSAAAP